MSATDISVTDFIGGAMQAITGNDDTTALQSCLKVDDVITRACEDVYTDAHGADALHLTSDLGDVWKLIYDQIWADCATIQADIAKVYVGAEVLDFPVNYIPMAEKNQLLHKKGIATAMTAMDTTWTKGDFYGAG